MRCLCGQNLNEIAIREKCTSYAVIRDEEYLEVLSMDQQTINAHEDEKLSYIAASSRKVGTLIVCCRCGRLVFNEPGGEVETQYYSKEK